MSTHDVPGTAQTGLCVFYTYICNMALWCGCYYSHTADEKRWGQEKEVACLGPHI